MAGLLGGGGGGPVDTVTGLAGGITGGGLPLDAVTGLLGSGEGLNIAGLVGVGSDEKALLDLNPAKKKEVKAKEAAEAAKRKQAREQELKKLQEAVRNQGGQPTLDQQQAFNKLTTDQHQDNQKMERVNKLLDAPTQQPSSTGPVSDGLGTAEGVLGSTPAGNALGGATSAVSGATGALGGATGALDALTGGLGDVAGGLGGLGGGLLGNGQGLNVAGLLAIGSDEDALLDLNPAEKKKKKLEKLQALQREKALQQQQKQALIDQHKKQGNHFSPPQEAAWRELQTREAATSQAESSLVNSIKSADAAAASGAGGMQSAGAGSVPGDSKGCLCLAPADPRTLPPPSLLYAYLHPANADNGQSPYILTFANANVAQHWYQAVAPQGVQMVTPQWYTYANPPFPLVQDARFANSSIAGQMMASRIDTSRCAPVLPPQTADGYMVPPRTSHVHVANATCQPSSNGSGTANAAAMGPGNTYTPAYGGQQVGGGGGGYQVSSQSQAPPGSWVPPQPAGIQPTQSGSFQARQPDYCQPAQPGTYQPAQAGTYRPGQSGYYQPSRPKYTLEQAAADHAKAIKATGDPRPIDQIYQEALGDLKGSCCGPSGPIGASKGASQLPASNGFAPGGGGYGPLEPGIFNTGNAAPSSFVTQPGSAAPGGGALPGLSSNGLGQAGQGLPGSAGQSLPGAGGGGLPDVNGLLGGVTGLLGGGGQGLNVAGIVGLGSDQDAILDLNPAEKAKVRQQKAQQLAQQKQAAARKLEQYKQLHQRQGRLTPEQQQDYNQTLQVVQSIGNQEQALAAGASASGLPGVPAGLPDPGALTSTLPVGGGGGGLGLPGGLL